MEHNTSLYDLLAPGMVLWRLLGLVAGLLVWEPPPIVLPSSIFVRMRWLMLVELSRMMDMLSSCWEHCDEEGWQVFLQALPKRLYPLFFYTV